jgi:hypothetical protein
MKKGSHRSSRGSCGRYYQGGNRAGGGRASQWIVGAGLESGRSAERGAGDDCGRGASTSGAGIVEKSGGSENQTLLYSSMSGGAFSGCGIGASELLR